MDELKLQLALSKTRMELKETQKILGASEARKNQLETVLGVLSGDVVPGFPTPKTLIDVRMLAKQELAHAVA